MFPNTYFVGTYYPDTYFPPPGEAATGEVGNFQNWDFSQGKAPQDPVVNPFIRVADIEPLRHAANYQYAVIADAIARELRGDYQFLVCPGTELPVADGRMLFKTEAVAHEASYQIQPFAAACCDVGGTKKLKSATFRKYDVVAAGKPKKVKKSPLMAGDTCNFTAQGYDNLTDEQLLQIVRTRRRRRNAK